MKFLKNNALSITFALLFIISLGGQFVTGMYQHNEQLISNGRHELSAWQYASSGHFIQATFENWESEFLQMGLFVLLTIWLRQKGSSESKKFEPEEVEREPDAKTKGAPWPVRKGGFILVLYKNSLSIAFFALFAVSFYLHFHGSYLEENAERNMQGKVLVTQARYIFSSRFWFESFQNWQSEFLSVFAIVILSVYLRQQGSPQSKPVDAPNSETGES